MLNILNDTWYFEVPHIMLVSCWDGWIPESPLTQNCEAHLQFLEKAIAVIEYSDFTKYFWGYNKKLWSHTQLFLLVIHAAPVSDF